MIYREINTAPESKKVEVIWGEKGSRPECGTASRLGNQWYIYGQPNPHANGRPCAVPDGWLPRDRAEWTRAEKTLCDILAMHPELRDEARH